MRVVGLIFLMLALYAGYKSVTTVAPPQATAAYQTGYRIGQLMWPVVFTVVGLWLLLRDGRGSIQSRPRQPNRVPVPAAPPVPSQVSVKINCSCGQNYAFDVEPIAGRMPAPVKCPACGADGTEAANAIIAETLAARLQTLTRQQPQNGAKRRILHPALLVTVVALLFVLVAVSLSRQLTRRNRISHPRPGAQAPWTAPDASPPQRDRSGPRSAGGTRNPADSSRLGSPREAAPVPSNVTEVEVFWGNRWWPATILKRDGQRAYVHYERWSSARDEWVTPDRLRPRPPK